VSLRLMRLPALAGWLLLLSFPATGEGLTLQQALDRALAGHPSVAAESATAEALRQQGLLDALPPAWLVSADLEQFGGTGSLSGFDSAETTLRLGRSFELGGKREARTELAGARVAAQEHESGLRRLDIAALATLRFYDVLAGQARIELAERELDLARETREAVAQRVARGASPAADLPLAELAVARMALELEDARRELQSARVALSVLWGERSPSFVTAVGSLDPTGPVPALQELETRLRDGAHARRYALQQARLDAEARTAEAARRPDVLGTVGVTRLEALDEQALVMSVTVPFGSARRGDLAASRVRAEKTALESQRQAEALDRYQALHAYYQELQHALHEDEALRREMIPAAERALELALQGYEAARYSFLHVADTRRVLYALHRDQIDAATRYHRLLTGIQRMTAPAGESLP